MATNQPNRQDFDILDKFGSGGRDRTYDQLINSQNYTPNSPPQTKTSDQQ
jgi:hypothetical protein